MDLTENYFREKIEFHCPMSRKLISTDDCELCPKRNDCDMYITMINEDND